jgi:hypothetical protein
VLLLAPLGFGHTLYSGDYRTRAAVARDAGGAPVAAPVARAEAASGVWTRVTVAADGACTVAVDLPGRWC